MYEKYYKRLAKIADTVPLEDTPQHNKSAENRVGFFQKQTESIRSGYKQVMYQSDDEFSSLSEQDQFTARSMAEMKAMAERLKAEAAASGTTSDSPYGELNPVAYTGKEDDALAYAVKSVESSHNYQAMGEVIKKGMYKGQRALGAYQIMEGNIPSWSKEALGREVSKKEFLENPEIQDAIFNHQMQKNISKYGTVEDAVSIWFTGRPYAEAKADGATDGNIMVDEYVRRFQVAYNDFNRDKAVR